MQPGTQVGNQKPAGAIRMAHEKSTPPFTLSQMNSSSYGPAIYKLKPPSQQLENRLSMPGWPFSGSRDLL